MSLVVVRCPACKGASRVSADALGHMVGCPRCQAPFVAEEEKAPPPAPTKPARARPVRANPARPTRGERDRPPRDPDAAPPVLATVAPDPEHDPHT
ncbi:MAG: hypothetical protein K2V38_18400, partial [Gemmataceae bacterium]|nr:hypothetical protein [Gemmataceae bacterium]